MFNLSRLREEAERAIRGAFLEGEAPSVDAMRNDHCPECEETAARFMGKRWPSMVVEDLLGNPAATLLTTPAFRYYLPAMMLLSMEFPVELDCLPDEVIGGLSPKGASPTGQDMERLRFTAAQARAIVRFLRFFELREKLGWSQPDWPDEAILAVPIGRPLERAIEFWTARASEDAA